MKDNAIVGSAWILKSNDDKEPRAGIVKNVAAVIKVDKGVTFSWNSNSWDIQTNS